MMRFKPFLGYMLFLTIRIRLISQKWDLIKNKVKHADLKYMGIIGQPVSSLILLYLVIITSAVYSFTPVSKEWFSEGQTVPRYILEAARNGEWWIIRSALNISEEVIC